MEFNELYFFSSSHHISELETSDSGGWTPRGRKEVQPPPRSLVFPSPSIEGPKEDDTPTNNLSLQDELASLPNVPSPPPLPSIEDTPSIAIVETKEDEVPPPDPKESQSDSIEVESQSERVLDLVSPSTESTPLEERKEEEITKSISSPLEVNGERSLLFSYDSEFSLAIPPQEKKMPQYLEEEERPPSR